MKRPRTPTGAGGRITIEENAMISRESIARQLAIDVIAQLVARLQDEIIETVVDLSLDGCEGHGAERPAGWEPTHPPEAYDLCDFLNTTVYGALLSHPEILDRVNEVRLKTLGVV
jgi:hypothetical protein